MLPSDPDPLVNTVTVEGLDSDGDTITATDTHTLPIVVTPAIEVVKTANVSQAHVGDDVTYTFTITHGLFSDGTPISDVTVTDDITGTATLATQTGGDLDLNLETGETWTYTATYTVLSSDPDPLVNTVTVEGLDSDGDTITATDTHTLPIVVTPAIEVVKTANVSQAHVGDTVTYTFTITHADTSDGTPITGLTVTDDIADAATLDTQTGGDLDLNLETGETWTYTATYTVLPTDPDPLVNTVTVEGLDSDGDTITATDTHTLPIVVTPVLDVVKTANVSQAHVGDNVTYTFTITHATLRRHPNHWPHRHRRHRRHSDTRHPNRRRPRSQPRNRRNVDLHRHLHRAPHRPRPVDQHRHRRRARQ